MGYYSEYLNKQEFDFESLSNERKNQIKKIQEIRERPVLIYASDLNKNRIPISIDYSDLLLFRDQIPEINSKK
ncbi:MAG: hypothetical protein OXM55_06525 [Bdellovibrionales bacterium]|nr:hypothetical protein [Bdellovibrionales bacterium]